MDQDFVAISSQRRFGGRGGGLGLPSFLLLALCLLLAACGRTGSWGLVDQYRTSLDTAQRTVIIRQMAQGEPAEAPTRFAQAYITAQSGKTGPAIALLDDLLAAEPDFADAYALRGALRLRLGNLEGALDDYEAARTHGTPDPFVALQHGGLLLAKGMLTSALVRYDEALDDFPGFARLHVARGVALSELARYTEAITAFDKALELDPNSAEAYYNRALNRRLASADNLQPAYDDYTQALRLQPDFVLALLNRGLIAFEQDRKADALADYNRAIALDTGFAQSYVNRGNLYVQLDKPDSALLDFAHALLIDPQMASAYNGRATVMGIKGRYEDAVGDFDRALKLDPQNPNLHFSRSLALMALGRPADACKGFQLALAAGHPDAQAFVELACK